MLLLALSLIYGMGATSILLPDMFSFYRSKQSYTDARSFYARGRLVCLALASVLLSATAAGSSFESKSSSARTPSVPQATTGQPELMMTASRRDFGDVFAGEELEASFAVRNDGRGPLELAQKSSLGMRPGEPRYPVTAAWHSNDGSLTRRAAALRIAPT
jgi:hypothetical protein